MTAVIAGLMISAMRIAAVIVAVGLVLTACNVDVQATTGTTSSPDTAGSDPCDVAQCEHAQWIPTCGGVEAGEGLPHIGCRLTVPNCGHRFEELCWTSPIEKARCPVLVD